MESVSSEEVKRVVFELGDLRALGIDRFNGLFYQKNWEVIQFEVCNSVQLFFSTGAIPEQVNETVVSLIPKINHPEICSHFRPISCCTFLYKIIARIMVTRLKGSMNSLISPFQSAFIGGRQIQDNLIVVQEAFHCNKKPGPRRDDQVIIKLDMNKAYDRLE